MNVPEPVQKLYEALSSIPPEFDKARELLAAYQPTEEELMWVACEVVDNTTGEYSDAMDKECTSVTPDRMHRSHLYDTILFLLKHGLKPNTVWNPDDINARNVMLALDYTDGPDVAASVVRLLMQHGGNPNLNVQGETPVTNLDCSMCLDPIYTRAYFDDLVQQMMVLQAYGGHWIGGDGKEHVSFVMREGYTSDIFKEFEKFDYRFGKEKGWPGNIHVFEKATGKTVADYV